jgi:hypothetical protein
VCWVFALAAVSALTPVSCGLRFASASTRIALLLFSLLRQAIGEDLFAIALDQPFRFPATFTFVLRAFSTLEVREGVAS